MGDKNVVKCRTCNTILAGGKVRDERKSSVTSTVSKLGNKFMDGMDKLKGIGDKNVVKCRTCNGEHGAKCPWRDTMLARGKVPDEKKSSVTSTADETGKQGGAKYVPTSFRDGAAKRTGAIMVKRVPKYFSIRIDNLSDSTTETELEDLVKPFGLIQKRYLAKDKITGVCEGFAYINYKFRDDAVTAISMLNGHAYNHLILSVDWSERMTKYNQ